MMAMSFFFSDTVTDLLFKGLSVSTTGGMVGLCIGILCFSLLYEGFKTVRNLIEKASLLAPRCNSGRSQRLIYHAVQSLLHMVGLWMSYLVMLIVMDYNAYFFIAVLVGAGIGYFIFTRLDSSKEELGALRQGSFATMSPEVPQASTDVTKTPDQLQPPYSQLRQDDIRDFSSIEDASVSSTTQLAAPRNRCGYCGGDSKDNSGVCGFCNSARQLPLSVFDSSSGGAH